MWLRPGFVLCALLLAACTPATGAAGDAEPSTPRAAATADAQSGGPAHSELEPSEGFDAATIAFLDGGRRVDVPVLVADEPGLRSTGLMHRTDLPRNAGMIFVFEATTNAGFWMKNTPLPLSIAFIGQDGTVQQLIDMEPCPQEPCETYAPDDPYLYAVEVHQGFYERQGITAGWMVDIAEVTGDPT